MAHQPDAVVPGHQTSDNFAGAVTTPIVDHNDLVRIDKCGKRRQRVLDDRVNIGLFIECGKNESKTAGESRYRRARGIRLTHPATASSAGGTPSSTGAADSSSVGGVHSSAGAVVSDSGAATSAPGYQPMESTP